MSQLLEAADIVAYGQLERLDGYNGTYTLHCILKNKDPSFPVPEEVTLNVLGRSSAACRYKPVGCHFGVSSPVHDMA